MFLVYFIMFLKCDVFGMVTMHKFIMFHQNRECWILGVLSCFWVCFGGLGVQKSLCYHLLILYLPFANVIGEHVRGCETWVILGVKTVFSLKE